MQLTEHFNLPEFTRSATAEANGIKNDLHYTLADDRRVIENLRNLCVQVLEPLREFVGGSVIISSGYRCKELNDLVEGTKTSQHMTGEAVDIVIGAERPRGQVPGSSADPGTCPHGRLRHDHRPMLTLAAHLKTRRKQGEIRVMIV